MNEVKKSNQINFAQKKNTKRAQKYKDTTHNTFNNTKFING